MPSTVTDLLDAAGLELAETVRWGSSPRLNQPGVYIVSLDSEPNGQACSQPIAPIDPQAVLALLAARPELRVDGKRPTTDALTERSASFWLPDETIVYAGLASSSVASRVRQYYRTLLGARSPHAGGWFLKTLSNLNELHVHCAAAVDSNDAESAMLRAFVENVSDAAKRSVADQERPLPFANLEWPRGVRKLHGITGARAPR